MSVWLTPDLKPFIGGTYFPPHDLGRRPGFKTVLLRIMEQVQDKSTSANYKLSMMDLVPSQSFLFLFNGSLIYVQSCSEQKTELSVFV